MTAKRKNIRYLVTISSLALVGAFAMLFGGCADAYYESAVAHDANKASHSAEAKYDTYYAPDYYPYYPWDAYYGGAYYYGE